MRFAALATSPPSLVSGHETIVAFQNAGTARAAGGARRAGGRAGIAGGLLSRVHG